MKYTFNGMIRGKKVSRLMMLIHRFTLVRNHARHFTQVRPAIHLLASLYGDEVHQILSSMTVNADTFTNHVLSFNLLLFKEGREIRFCNAGKRVSSTLADVACIILMFITRRNSREPRQDQVFR